jgi:hypothetical protein
MSGIIFYKIVQIITSAIKIAKMVITVQWLNANIFPFGAGH